MSWFKSTFTKLTATARDTARDLNAVAREAAREFSPGNFLSGPGNSKVEENLSKLRAAKSVSSGLEYLSRLSGETNAVLEPGLLESIAMAVASNPTLRRCCIVFPPASMVSENPKFLPTHEEIFSFNLYSLFTRNLRGPIDTWRQTLEIFFRSSVAVEAQVGVWVRQMLSLLAIDQIENLLQEEGNSLVRKLRESREELSGSPNDLQKSKEVAELAKKVHLNIKEIEELRGKRKEWQIGLVAEILSETEIYLKAIDEKCQDNKVIQQDVIKQIESIRDSLQNELQQGLSLEIETCENDIRKLMQGASEAQGILTNLTGEISKVREQRNRVDGGLSQIKRAFETAKIQTDNLIAEERKTIAVAEADMEISAQLPIKEILQFLNSDPILSPISNKFRPRVVQLCVEYISLRENELRDQLSSLQVYRREGSVVHEEDGHHDLSDVSEQEAKLVVDTLNVSENLFGEADRFAKEFSAFIKDIHTVNEVIDEIRKIANPYKVRMAEISLLREISADPGNSPISNFDKKIPTASLGASLGAVISADVTNSAFSSPADSPVSVPKPAIKRKDSFEDLLGI